MPLRRAGLGVAVGAREVGVGLAPEVGEGSGEASGVASGVSLTWGEGSPVGDASATTCPTWTLSAIILKIGHDVCSHVSEGPMAHIPYQLESFTVAAI